MNFTFFSFCSIHVLTLRRGVWNIFKHSTSAWYWDYNISLHRAESTTTNIHGKYQTTQNSNFTVSTGDEGSSSLVLAIVVPLLVLVIIVTIGIAWWKKKEIRKLIRDFGDFHFMISLYNLFLSWQNRNIKIL